MNDILSGLLKNIAPGLATAVMGPMGGAAVSALASKFGVSDSVEAVAKAIAGDPQAAQKLQEVELEFYKIEQNNLTDRLKVGCAPLCCAGLRRRQPLLCVAAPAGREAEPGVAGGALWQHRQ
jgi:hypothetical protein